MRAIHAAAARRKLDDDEYRALLEARFHVRTCKRLSRRQADELLTVLTGRRLPPSGPAPPRRPKTRPAPRPEGVAALPTPAQTALIEELSGRVEWREPDGAARWMLASFGWCRPRTVEDAAAVIEGLKSLCRQEGRWAQ